MNDKELRGLLVEILDVIGSLADKVHSITPPSDYRISDAMEYTEREDAMQTGKVRPRKSPSLPERVASLRARVESLQPSDDSGA
jgi:hypothetical protein